MKKHNIKVNCIDSSGNQFKIKIDGCSYFQSYMSIICMIDENGDIYLDERFWNYSSTTGKYRNIFLNEDKKATEKKIKSGEYKLINLN